MYSDKNVSINQLKNNHNFFDIIIILRLGETRVAKEEPCSVKNPMQIWDVDVNNIAISKLFETRNSSMSVIGCLD